MEFALVLPLLCLLLLGVLDFGRCFNYWIDETHLSHEGSRWAAVNKNPGPGASLQQSIRMQSDTPELRNGGSSSTPNPLQVCIDFPNGTTNVGDPVRTSITTTYNFLAFLGNRIGITQKTVTATSTMRIEVPPTNYSAGCA